MEQTIRPNSQFSVASEPLQQNSMPSTSGTAKNAFTVTGDVKSKKSRSSTSSAKRKQLELQRLEEEFFGRKKLQEDLLREFLDKKYAIQSTMIDSLDSELDSSADEQETAVEIQNEKAKMVSKYVHEQQASATKPLMEMRANNIQETPAVASTALNVNNFPNPVTRQPLTTGQQAIEDESRKLPFNLDFGAIMQNRVPFNVRNDRECLPITTHEPSGRPSAPIIAHEARARPPPPTNTHEARPSAPITTHEAREYPRVIRHEIQEHPGMPPASYGSQQGTVFPTRQQQMARKSINTELPEFSGKPEDWTVFISTFEMTTELCGFSNLENLMRMRKAIKGEALETVRHRLNLPNCIPEIIRELRSSFGRPELLIHVQMEKLRKQTAVTCEDVDSVIKFSNSIRDLCATMEASGNALYLCDPTMLAELTHKLPTMLYYAWANYKLGLRAVNLLTFSSWLMTQAEALKYDKLTGAFNKTPKSRANQREPKKLFVNVHDQKPPAPVSNEKKVCPACKSDGCSTLKECDVFKRLSVSERWNLVKSNKLCRTCLKYHNRHPCKNVKPCNVNGCTFKHNPMLHESSSTSVQSNVPASTSVQVTPTLSHSSSSSSRVIFRIIPVIVHGVNSSVHTYAFLDDGSSITLMEEDLADELGLVGEKEPLCLEWTSNTKRTESDSRKVELAISGTTNTKQFTIEARTVKLLGLPVQSLDVKSFPHLENLPIESYNEAVPRILIGLDNWHLGSSFKQHEGSFNQPIATKTRIGWCVFGPLGKTDVAQIYSHNIVQCNCETAERTNDDLHQHVKDYFAVESLGVEPPRKAILSTDDSRAIEILHNTTKRIGKKFEAGLLWKFDNFQLPDSYGLAKRRLGCLLRKLTKNPEMADQLDAKILDYKSKGYIREASEDELQQNHKNIWYLPVFPVVNPNKPNKIRLVWDAAATVNGVSLNSLLLKGPDQLAPMNQVLFGFRERPVAISADIAEMYHQVQIRSEDQQVQRFLWSFKGQTEPTTFVMQSMLFGTSCSPAIAQYVKNENAKEFSHQYPEAANAIVKKHYVDDYLDSLDTEEEAIRLAEDVRHVHEEGGFFIRNWVSNSKTVADHMNGVPSSNQDVPIYSNTTMDKVLGVWWSTENDTIQFKVSSNTKNRAILFEGKRPTKRELLSVVMSIYDPIGFLAHIMIFVKVLLQDVWRAQLNWDDEINEELFARWTSWVSLLPKIESIQIPRCYGIDLTGDAIELHVFVDSSDKAYAAVAYLRTVRNGTVKMSLVSAKTRVAPLKILSIPRLELEACVLGARLANAIRDGHSIKINSCHLWSDSQTALGWIKSDSRKYKQFVAFRVAEILENSEANQWRYVPSSKNIADRATKWPKCVFNIDHANQWLSGPDFLYEDSDKWPKTATIAPPEDEMRVKVLHHKIERRQFVQLDPADYSSWNRLRRRMAYVLRFVHNLKAAKTHQQRRNGPISKDDYVDAENYLFRKSQHETYAEETEALKRGEPVSKKSKIYCLSPYLDELGVMRCRGRIDAARVSFDTKRPIILSKDNHISKLIVSSYHEKYLHINFETVINEVRQRYMISHLRVFLKSIIKNCQKCKVRKAKPIPPLMGPLPSARLMSYTRPFTYMGIDFFGPMLVTIGRSEVKRWGVLATCLTTRAVHIETCSSLSTDICILVLRAIFARRGTPVEIYSDNGTNFRGASKELQRAVEVIDKDQLAREFNSPQTQWIFIPPSSPHMGGSWERLVRSVKTALSQLTTTRNPTDEVLRCMLIEVENMINSRPLTYIPLNAENDEALTPNHFLLGSSNGMKPLGVFSDKGLELRKAYLMAQRFGKEFFKRWTNEMLPDLTRRTKWYDTVKPIEKGDIVIIVDDQHPPNCWPKGRVIETFKSSDGQVRKAVVQTPNGIYTRPAVKLAVLDVAQLGKAPEVAIPGGSVDDGNSAQQD